MDKGVELIARHAFMPNKLLFCGSTDLSKNFLNFFKTGKNEKKIKKELKKFKPLYANLSFLAKKNNLKPFDFRVGEAYFVGNKLCKTISKKDLKRLILSKYSRRDFLGKKKAQDLAKKIPLNVFFHHSFFVFFINFLTKKVKPSIENFDNCRISWGKIIKAEKEKVLVEFKPVELKNNEFILGKTKTKWVQNFFLEKLKQGDWISIHWNAFCQKLSKKQLNNLKFFTIQNLKAINFARKKQNHKKTFTF